MMRAYGLLILTVIIYAGNLLVGKVLNDYSPVTVTFFRLFIAFLIMLPLGMKQFMLVKWSWKRNYWLPLLGMSFTGVILFNVFVYLSLHYTSSTNASIVESTTPIFTFLLGYILLKERLNKLQLFGMFLSIIGAFWVISKGSIGVIRHLQINIGDLFMVIAVILWAIYTIIVKRHNHKYPVYGGLLVMLSLGVFSLLPFVLISWNEIIEVLTNYKALLGLLYLGIFPSIIALISWNRAVEEIGASKASIFLNLLPVFTTVGAVTFLHEEIIAAQLIGGALVVTGVVLTIKTKRNQKVVEEPEDVTLRMK